MNDTNPTSQLFSKSKCKAVHTVQVLAILDEYYVNGDIQDAATTLQVGSIVLCF